jgi:hypothetical protein
MIGKLRLDNARTAILLGVILPVVVLAQPATRYNYGEALQKAIYFYDAQRSGKLGDTNRVLWRGDSAVDDGAQVGVDLSGGWYDAGDHVKFGFPMASSTTLLAWGALEYGNAFRASGQDKHMLDNLRWVADYFMKASNQPNQLWGQVGNGAVDHAFWGPAEIMTMQRPAYRISAQCPGSDLAGETAAALTVISMVFRKQSDTAYADALLARAKGLFSFADNFRGRYSDCVTDAANFYRSWSGFIDELVWSAAWLFRATGDSAYLDKAKRLYEELPKQPGMTVRSFAWTHNWDDKSFGSYILLAMLDKNTEYRNDAERWLDYWTSGYSNQRIRYTPGGLAWLDQWGSLRYSANTAFLALVYSDWLEAQGADSSRISRYRSFAERQINYMLGDNPTRRSYMVGFGNNPPANPHHRTAHGSWSDNISTPGKTSHTLYGALVGGPDAFDSYSDDRRDYIKNEVATDYNAGLVGALARLYQMHGGPPLADFPPRETPDREELSVEARVNALGANFVEVSAFVTNRTAWPARLTDQLSLRYFFTLDSGDPADIAVSAAFNHCRPPTGPVQWSGDTYYVQVDCTGVRIFPGGLSNYRKEVQFRISSRNQWVNNNDWSFHGLSDSDSPPGPASNIVLYEAGKRVWGQEAAGGEPTPLSILPTPLPTARAGVAYSAELRAGGGAPPYSEWKLIAGELPSGLTLDDKNGKISGIPEAEGTSSATLQVTDSAAATAAAEFPISVQPAAALEILTRTLPRGFVGFPYRTLMQATGGIPPYVWKITGSDSPPGLTLDNGLLSGVPLISGTLTLVIEVRDKRGSTATESMELVLQSSLPVPDGKLSIRYRALITANTGNQISPQVEIVNLGTEAIPLTELKLRYYFTLEGDRPLNWWCDYARVGCRNITRRFQSGPNNTYYMEIGFTEDAGQLSPGGTSGEVQVRFAKDDWSEFLQSDDYSFDPTKIALIAWERVPLFRSGVLVWGTEFQP